MLSSQRARLFDLLFFREESNRPLCSFAARFCFIFMQLQLHSHVGAAQYERALLLSTAPQDRWTQIKRVRSPQCISSSVNVKFRFNEHAAAALFVWCYKMLCYYYCSHFLSKKKKKNLFYLLTNSLQLLCSCFLLCSSFIHPSLKHLQYRMQVHEMLPAFNVPAQICAGFLEEDRDIPGSSSTISFFNVRQINISKVLWQRTKEVIPSYLHSQQTQSNISIQRRFKLLLALFCSPPTPERNIPVWFWVEGGVPWV